MCTDPLLGKGYNVTCDNFFTSLSLCKFLLQKKTTLVGTIRLNSHFLIEEQRRQLSIYESDFFIDETKKIISVGYQGKKKKKVMLLSSHHGRAKIEGGQKKKPEIVQFYNETKSGVDVLDSMVRMYSTKATTRRWPVAMFYDLLDKSALNSWVLYKQATEDEISRKEFIILLAKQLCRTSSEGENNYDEKEKEKKAKKRKTCAFQKCHNKTYQSCFDCYQFYCGNHSLQQKIVQCHNCSKGL